MAKKPSYEELEKRIAELERESARFRRTEDELFKLYHAVNQSPSAIVITDARGIIEYVNPKFMKMTGFSEKEILGTSAADLGEQSPEDEKQMWETIQSGGDWHGEFRNKKKDGGRYWERASISSIKDESGSVTHYVKVAEDITDLKRAQAALSDSQKQLYDHQRRMGILAFANEMAMKLMHELRNPLVSIGGYSKRIASGDYTNDKLGEYTKIIFEQAKRLDKALSDVLVQLETAATEV
jgi:PAS domain S-box-containing protein